MAEILREERFPGPFACRVVSRCQPGRAPFGDDDSCSWEAERWPLAVADVVLVHLVANGELVRMGENFLRTERRLVENAAAVASEAEEQTLAGVVADAAAVEAKMLERN